MPNWCATGWTISGTGDEVKNFMVNFKAAFASGVNGNNCSPMIRTEEGNRSSGPLIFQSSIDQIHPDAVHTPFTCSLHESQGFQYVWGPTYTVLSSVPLLACDECGAIASMGASLARCGKCKRVVYCSKACQRTAWAAGHKAQCLPHRMSIVHTSKWNPPWSHAEWARIAAAFPGSSSTFGTLLDAAKRRLAVAKLTLAEDESEKADGGSAAALGVQVRSIAFDVLEMVGECVQGRPPFVINVKYAEQGSGIVGSVTMCGGSVVAAMERHVEEGECTWDEEDNEARYAGPFGKLLAMSG